MLLAWFATRKQTHYTHTHCYMCYTNSLSFSLYNRGGGGGYSFTFARQVQSERCISDMVRALENSISDDVPKSREEMHIKTHPSKVEREGRWLLCRGPLTGSNRRNNIPWAKRVASPYCPSYSSSSSPFKQIRFHPSISVLKKKQCHGSKQQTACLLPTPADSLNSYPYAQAVHVLPMRDTFRFQRVIEVLCLCKRSISSFCHFIRL